MFDSEELRLIKLLTASAVKKVKDNPEVEVALTKILTKIDEVSEITLPMNITQEEMESVKTMVDKIETNIRKYTGLNSGNNLSVLETIKKEITHDMSYLSTFRDKFIYEIEFIEEVFKKEIFSQLVKEISLRDGISVTQAEKIVNIDERYKKIRRDVHNLKLIIGNLKTKYSFFEKSLQLIIQSVSVAGKEMHNSKLES